MSISKVRLPNNTEEDIKAKYLIQSTSSDAVSAEFSARTVTEDAIATIQKIYGNTTKWNQMLTAQYLNVAVSGVVSAFSSSADGTYTITLSGAATAAINTSNAFPNFFTAGHKYYMRLNSSNLTYLVGRCPAIGDYASQSQIVSISSSFDETSSSNTFRFRIKSGAPAGTYTIRPWIVDLTAIYGSGNEPTVSEFEEQYPAAYYPYDSGSLTSNSATAILSRGFNQWDELLESGTISDTGAEATSTSYTRSSHYFACSPSTTYYVYSKNGTRVDICWYSSDKVFISKRKTAHNNASVSPSDAYYFRILFQSLIYDNEICVNISDTTKNGTYEPYSGHQIDLNIPTLTGKPNGVGSSVVIFPSGMQSNGTTRDELTATSAIKRIADDNSVLSTPQTYILDNALQLQYPVVSGGTEMVLPTTGTAPMKMDVIYGNAADATSNLSSNFISVDSMKAFLNNLGTQMGGTWNMQYNNGKFEFTFSSS